jgi:hypothetical protein
MLASLEHAKNALRRVVDAVEEPPAAEDAPGTPITPPETGTA